MNFFEESKLEKSQGSEKVKLLPHIPTDNIIELNKFISAGVKLVSDKIFESPKEPK